MWTQIRVILSGSDLGPHCLSNCFLKKFSRRQNHMALVVIDSLLFPPKFLKTLLKNDDVSVSPLLNEFAKFYGAVND